MLDQGGSPNSSGNISDIIIGRISCLIAPKNSDEHHDFVEMNVHLYL